jgi:cystathionine beta-lyase/cystathionine gamma-synthase
MSKRRLDTQLVHAGEPQPRIAGAVSMPIFQSSTYLSGGEASYHDIRYLRLNNSPNHDVLHDKLATIEGAEAALVAASGMAAISTTLLAMLGPSDHILAQRCLYGGTHELLTQDLATLGIEHTFVDVADPASWAAAVRPNTKAFYCESITNPMLDVGDLPAVAQFAREHELVSIIDNTFATPVNFRPIDHGFDLVVHSATKYLNGHSDIVAGAVMGRRDLVESIRRKLNHLGGTLDPHACFLLHRGLKTLAVRVRHHNASAQRLAEALSKHPRVVAVRYPGLASHPDHARATQLMRGFAGMLSFEVEGGLDAAQRVIDRLILAVDAPSLGGPETLVTRPAGTSHVGLEPQERLSLGISDGLIRVSVGLEDPDDLVADFEAALE